MPQVASRSKMVSDAVRRRESDALDDHLAKQIIKTWPETMPSDYANNIPYFQNLSKQRMKAYEDADPDIDFGPLTTKSAIEYRRFKTLRAILYYHTNPINNLPTEILTNIFRFVAWGTVDPSLGVNLRLRMTWVCRHWRNLLLEDSTLWCAIWFRDPPPYERSFAWFERSAGAPISIRINEYRPKPTEQDVVPRQVDMTPAQVSSLFDRVFTKFSQIEIFIVILNTSEAITAVLRKLNEVARTGVPNRMKRCEVHRTDHSLMLGDEMECLPLFGGAPTPSLTFLAVNGLVVDWNRTILSGLTTLDIRRMPLDVAPTATQFTTMLSSCPNLQKLVLDGCGPQPAYPGTYQPVIMPSLHTMVLGDFSRNYLRYILQLIEAPEVRDLTFMNLSGEDYGVLFGEIASSSSFNKVKILTLYTVHVVEQRASVRGVQRWFQSMPDVQYLRVAAAPQFLEILVSRGPPPEDDPDGPRPIPCPRLDILEFQHIELGTVAYWVQGRRALGVPPQSLYINSSYVRTAQRQINDILRPLQIPILIAPLGNTTPDELRIIAEDDMLEET